MAKAKRKTKEKVGQAYLYDAQLKTGQTIQVWSNHPGKYAAVKYGPVGGLGEVFQTKAQAKAFLKNLKIEGLNREEIVGLTKAAKKTLEDEQKVENSPAPEAQEAPAQPAPERKGLIERLKGILKV